MMQLILLLLFFFSGLSALVYQTIWIRQFSLVFGVDVFATATVLTAFMAGLALGSYLFGRLVDRDNRPLRLFALLELGIAVFAVLFPLSFSGLEWLYGALYRSLSLGFYATQLYRFALAFFFLLIPTMLMGGTLPVLSRIFVKRVTVLGSNVGKLYSINNLGALIGCFLSGFFLIRWLGQHSSMMVAALLNFFNAIVVLILLLLKQEKKSEVVSPADEQNEETLLPSRVIRFVLWAFAIEGFAALAYEVIWTRILLGFSYDKSLYFFSTVIFSFIFGLSFGSILVAKMVDRRKNLLLLFAVVEILIAVSALVLLSGFVSVNNILSEWRLQYRDADGWWRCMGKEYLLFFLIMAIPTTFMGMTFPIVSKICTPHLRRLGTRLGEIGFLDTVGSIVGSFAAGFILIPFLGVIKSAAFVAMINIIIGILAVLLNPFLSKRWKAPIIASVIAVVFVLMTNLPDSGYFRHWQTKRQGDRLLFYQEGA
ncbi:MAG: MFS transporter, partial [Calditrichaeota bacterium]